MENRYQKIAFLYPNQKDEVYQKLRQILEDFKKTFKPKFLPAGFSEKDVVLICYPDHVFSYGNYPLQVLHQFLKKYALGLVNKIHLLPFFPYSSDEGFSVVDYYQVRPDLGDWEDVQALSRDFGLLVDLVLNHVSAKSQWFKGFLAGDPQFKDYFIAFEKEVDTSSVYRPRAHSLLTPFKMATSPVSPKFLWTTFSSDQIDLNYKNPQVFLEMVKVLLFYLRQGAAAIRLDAVRYLWKELGTTCVDLPQTHLLVKILREIIEEVAAGVWLVSEVKGSLSQALSYFGNGYDETHLVYNFQLPALLLWAFFRGEATGLSQWAQNL